MTSNLRAPGKIANVFAVEGFTDEIAAAVGVDPLEFRLSRLTDPRAIEALTRTATAFGWQTRTSPNPQARQGNLLVGRGIAYMRYKQAENYVAHGDGGGGGSVERQHRRQTGHLRPRLRPRREPRRAAQPGRGRHRADAQPRAARGSDLRSVARDERRLGELSDPDVSRGACRSRSILIDRPDQPLLGAGEAATAPVAAALANAVFDATGVRLRTVPFTTDRVKAALASK